MDLSIEMEIWDKYWWSGYEVCEWLLCANRAHSLSMPLAPLFLVSFPVMNLAEPSWSTVVDHVVDFSPDIWVQECGHDHGHWQPCLQVTEKNGFKHSCDSQSSSFLSLPSHRHLLPLFEINGSSIQVLTLALSRVGSQEVYVLVDFKMGRNLPQC